MSEERIQKILDSAAKPFCQDHTRRRGEDASRAQITEGLVLAIRAMDRDGFSQAQIAREFGLGRAHVRSIVKRNTWRHI